MGAAKKLEPKSGKLSAALTELKSKISTLSELKKPSAALKKFTASQKIEDVAAYLEKVDEPKCDE